MWFLTVFRYRPETNSKEVLFTDYNEFLSPLLLYGESIVDDARGIYYECKLLKEKEKTQ